MLKAAPLAKTLYSTTCSHIQQFCSNKWSESDLRASWILLLNCNFPWYNRSSAFTTNPPFCRDFLSASSCCLVRRVFFGYYGKTPIVFSHIYLCLVRMFILCVESPAFLFPSVLTWMSTSAVAALSVTLKDTSRTLQPSISPFPVSTWVRFSDSFLIV